MRNRGVPSWIFSAIGLLLIFILGEDYIPLIVMCVIIAYYITKFIYGISGGKVSSNASLSNNFTSYNNSDDYHRKFMEDYLGIANHGFGFYNNPNHPHSPFYNSFNNSSNSFNSFNSFNNP